MLGIILTPYGKIPGAYPSEIGYSYGGDGTFLCPPDPQHYTKGEAGYYYDTSLGAPADHQNCRKLHCLLPPVTLSQMGWFTKRRVMKQIKQMAGLRGLGHSVPTDFEIAPYYGYTPDMDGWVVAKEGFQPGSWIPPNGWNPAGAYGPPMAPRNWPANMPRSLGFADATTDAQAQTQATIDALTAAEARNSKLFILSVISTTAIAISALVTTIRNAKLIKQERRLLDEEEALVLAHG